MSSSRSEAARPGKAKPVITIAIAKKRCNIVKLLSNVRRSIGLGAVIANSRDLGLTSVKHVSFHIARFAARQHIGPKVNQAVQSPNLCV
jgi:hypothetical protein